MKTEHSIEQENQSLCGLHKACQLVLQGLGRMGLEAHGLNPHIGETEEAQEALRSLKEIAHLLEKTVQEVSIKLVPAQRFEPSPLSTVTLSDAGKANGMVARVFGPTESSYGELSVSVHDAQGNCCADVIVGLDPQMNLRVGITSNADGMGDKNIVVHPLEPARFAVSVDTHNCEAVSEAARPHEG